MRSLWPRIGHYSGTLQTRLRHPDLVVCIRWVSALGLLRPLTVRRLRCQQFRGQVIMARRSRNGPCIQFVPEGYHRASLRAPVGGG